MQRSAEDRVEAEAEAEAEVEAEANAENKKSKREKCVYYVANRSLFTSIIKPSLFVFRFALPLHYCLLKKTSCYFSSK